MGTIYEQNWGHAHAVVGGGFFAWLLFVALFVVVCCKDKQRPFDGRCLSVTGGRLADWPASSAVARV